MDHSVIFSLAVICCVVSFSRISQADSTNCIKPVEQEKLVLMQGDYIASSLLKDILEKKTVFDGFAKWNGEFSEIMVNAEQGHIISQNHKKVMSYVSGFSWHEGEVFSEDGIGRCLIPLSANTFALRENDHTREVYEKILQSPEKYLFTRLLSGCYDADSGEKFCFYDDSIKINDQKKHAILILDGSELGDEGNYLKVDGESLFWVLVPNDKGWNLYRSDWASSDKYVPIDLKKPWKVLIRTSSADIK